MIEVVIEGIGPVFFETSQKARNINISVRYPNKVRVAVPKGISFKEAERVARSKAPWIKKNISKLSSQINLNKQLESIDFDYAKNYLIKRFKYLADLHGFYYGKITIRNQKTRWGSCSENNNISLNIKLICLPERLIDYVILHELTHTKIKNHSAYFWSFLSQYVDNPKKIDSSLKRYSCA